MENTMEYSILQKQIKGKNTYLNVQDISHSFDPSTSVIPALLYFALYNNTTLKVVISYCQS